MVVMFKHKSGNVEVVKEVKSISEHENEYLFIIEWKKGEPLLHRWFRKNDCLEIEVIK